MRKTGILQKLTKVGTVKDNSFISIYLNAEPNEHGRDDFNVFLKKQLSIHESKLEEESLERESFQKDAEKINNYAQKASASANGIAIFACSEADYFQAFEFDVPFKKNQFEVGNQPLIFPLAKLVDQNPEFAVVLADSNNARIYLMQRGKVLNIEEIDNEKYNRSEVGGWSQMRFQRHIDEMRKQHAKEVVDELEKIVRAEDVRQIVLAGNLDFTIPLLHEQMSDFLSKKTVGEVRINIDASENEIMNEAEKTLQEYDAKTDKEKIEQLIEQNYDEGKGVTGVGKTLRALANGQVQELYLTVKLDELEFDEKEIEKILDEYLSEFKVDIKDEKFSTQIADHLIIKALESAESIRFIEDETLLEEFGGVGALLRYTMSANQNQ